MTDLWKMGPFPLGPPPMAEDNNEMDNESMASDDIGSVNHQQRAYYSLFLLMAIAPVVMFAVLPFWERYWKKRRLREAAERRIFTTKLAEPIREAHLEDLMKDYSMVLSNSDVFDGANDSDEEEEQFAGSSNAIESADYRNEGGSNDDLPEIDDIEMQLPKENNSKKEEGGEKGDDGDANSLECDNSHCQHRSFCIPVPGQRVETFGATNLPRQTTSEGCAICMNPFEVGQKVVWSSNPDCLHVFHHQCLLEWFVAVGTKAWKAKASRCLDMDPAAIEEKICKFPKLCPFCRRDYFLEGNQEAAEDNNNDNDNENSNSSNDNASNNNDTPTTGVPSLDIEEEDVEQSSISNEA